MAVRKSDSPSSSTSAIRSYSDGPPWVFKGRALYQLHAVKSSVARRFIPPELKLVEAFGYTLGGIFLAHYDGSPAGEFDEAVVIAGIVWNGPTSCAWAGRILVSSEEARIHGRREVGLPSHFANFSHKLSTLPTNARAWFGGNDQKRSQAPARHTHSVKIVQRDGNSIIPLCEIAGIPRLSRSADDEERRWKGLAVQLHLPNFSGKTEEQPSLLKYSCAMNCRVRVVSPARLIDISDNGEAERELDVKTRDVVYILKGKPLASIFFDEMMMSAGAPTVLHLKDGERKKAANPGDVGPVVPAASSAISG